MAPETETRSFVVAKKSWIELYDHVKLCRSKLREAIGRNSWGSFEFRSGKDQRTGRLRTRLYGLGSMRPDRDHTLMYVDIPAQPDAAEKELHWRALLEETDNANDKHVMSKEEELLRERMRCTISGITSFDTHKQSGTLLFAAGLNLYMCKDHEWADKLVPSVLKLSVQEVGAPLDPNMCPGDPNLVAYVCKNDIHLHYGSTSRRATFVGNSGNKRSAGIPSFIIQEEFDRYSSIWWGPERCSGGGRHFLLYEETDESSVVELTIAVPASRRSAVDLMNYPLAGTPNAQSSLKLLDIRISSASDTIGIEVRECCLWENLKSLFPWMEYLVRAGWTPDGKGIWAHLMSRKQTRMALIYIPRDCFVEMDGSMQDLSKSANSVTVLYEEVNAIWINYNDCLCFLESECESEKLLSFLWWSEKTGFGHLYLIRAEIVRRSGVVEDLDKRNPYGPVIREEIALTRGNWPVMRKIQPVVDEQRGLVFFLGLKDSPVETHLYVTSYRDPGEMKRLTAEKLSHFSNRWERSLHVDVDAGLFVDWMSSVECQPSCVIFQLVFGDGLPSASPRWTLSLPQCLDFLIMETDQNGAESLLLQQQGIIGTVESGVSEDVSPEIISYTSSNSGFSHYAMLFRPVGWEEGVGYPVLLYVYGGPEVQLVRNVWSSWNGFHKYLSLGYVVVMMDGRGSAMRGLQFEGMIKYKMGAIEVDDQVEGLRVLAEKTNGLLDLKRVAIFGWSYGGYLALQGLIQRPDIFKVGIVGGPVTTWYLYDTGYTERYMGLPQEEGEAYKAGSVLARVSDLPDEPGRLIILHGLIDENVHFQHTAKLIEALIRAGKPYQLQVFPKERHGVRGNEGNEHMDVTVLNHLQTHL